MNRSLVQLASAAAGVVMLMSSGGAAAVAVVPGLTLDVEVRNQEGTLLGNTPVLTLTGDPTAKTQVYSMTREPPAQGGTPAWQFTPGPQTVTYNPDPLINYGFGVQNNTAGILTFSFSFSGGYTGGPYSLVTSNHSGTLLTDAGGGAVTLNPPAFATIHNPFVDATPIVAGQLGDGCSVGPSSSGACDGFGPDVLIPYTTLAAGTFGVDVSFKLSPGEVYILLGEIELAQIPEPGTWALMLSGLLGILAVARRRIA